MLTFYFAFKLNIYNHRMPINRIVFKTFLVTHKSTQILKQLFKLDLTLLCKVANGCIANT